MKDRLLNEYKKYKGQLVITDGFTVEHLIGFGLDDMDYYWIFSDGKKIKWHSCVCGFTPLKGFIPDKSYNNLVRLAQLNSLYSPNLWNSLSKGDEVINNTIKINNDFKEKSIIRSNPNDRIFDICWNYN